MPDNQILVFPLNPFGPVGVVVYQVQQRIHAFASERVSELDPEVFTRNVMQRLYGGDQTQIVLVFWDSEASKIVGHAVAEVNAQGRNGWVFVTQCKVDGNVGDAVKRAIEMVDVWADALAKRGNGQVEIRRMLFATHRSDTAWEKKYGFHLERKILTREIGSEIPGRKQEKDEEPQT